MYVQDSTMIAPRPPQEKLTTRHVLSGKVLLGWSWGYHRAILDVSSLMLAYLKDHVNLCYQKTSKTHHFLTILCVSPVFSVCRRAGSAAKRTPPIPNINTCRNEQRTTANQSAQAQDRNTAATAASSCLVERRGRILCTVYYVPCTVYRVLSSM